MGPCYISRKHVYQDPYKGQDAEHIRRAFQYTQIDNVWTATMPSSNANVVVTHGPAKGHVDASSPVAGCAHLLRDAVRVKPVLHVYEHVHMAREVEAVDWDAVQWGCDRFQLREGGLRVMGVMLGVWIWTWMR
jgi:hypothetical protein